MKSRQVTFTRVADRPADPRLFGIANRVARALGVDAALVTVVDEEK